MSIQDIFATICSSVQPAYTLEVNRAGVLAQALSVVSFSGHEALGELSRFVIRLTHPQADLPRASFLGVPATFGQAYHWGRAHLSKEQAAWEAQLRHEAALSAQITYHGNSNVLGLIPGAVFRIPNKVLPDAKYGQLITSITHAGARDVAYHNSYTAIPSDRLYRLPLNQADWPRIAGTVSARIASPDRYPYAHINQDGDYRVQFDFDRDAHLPAKGSCWMRLAKPFAGARQTGFHFPLIDGTEVAVAFHNGDPDRPYIAHAMHDSANRDLITNQNLWASRNEIRTQSNNKLRMEDRKDRQHVKLATEHGKSQLNLGHLVDAEKKLRGEGVELRTDGWASVRGGKGLFLSADAQPKARGRQLDMQAAQALLEQALQQMQTLGSAAEAAQAIAADYHKQQELLTETLSELKQAGIVISAPRGIALASGSHLQMSAADNLIATAGGNADIGVMKKISLCAGEAISLLACKLGLKLFAAKGKVEIQAQDDDMQLLSDKNMQITSANGRVTIEAKEELLLKCGGSYFRMSATGIEDGTCGDRTIKSASFRRQGPSSLAPSLNSMKHTDLFLAWPPDNSRVPIRKFSR